MEETPNSTLETRQDHMISPAGFKNLRPAHFLKSSLGSNEGDIFNIPPHSLASLPQVFDHEHWPLTVSFHGWRNPQRKWKDWVEKMLPLHQSTWKKAGIFEAILNSTYSIRTNEGLLFGFAERWCPETRSFVFPWGEATITLEDMMVISGYSVLGSSVATISLETEELKEIEARLIEARKETARTPGKKAYHNLWMKNLKDSGNEIEHVAFLSLWLSRFVLPTSTDVISNYVFPIAIHLARGTRIALAPAVLASIYRDLSLLKGKFVALTKLGSDDNCRGDDGDGLSVVIFSPFQLVQAWVWERFPQLRPQPNLIDIGQPRLALWHGLKQKLDNVRTVLSSKHEIFTWRPYTKSVGNSDFPIFYGETEMWVSPSLCSEELLSFAQCLRASSLEGLGCTENYFPHRVARQFGFDQDVPCCVSPSIDSPDTNYSRPFDDVKLYIPSRNFEADVTARYVEWWKESMLILEAARENVVAKNTSFECLRKLKRPKRRRRYKPVSSFNLTPEVSGGGKEKVDKQHGNSKTTLKDLKGNKARSIVKRCGIAARNQEKKGDKTVSSFKITPKRLNGTAEGRTPITTFKITPKRPREMKEGVSSSVNSNTPLRRLIKSQKVLDRKSTGVDESAALGNPSKKRKVSTNCPCLKKQENVLSGSPGLPQKGSKEAAEASKTKKGIAKLPRSSPLKNSEHILGQSSEQPERCLKRKLEENNSRPPAGTPKTAKPITTFSIVKKTKSLVPPVFFSESITVAARDSPEEVGLTIQQILKSSNLRKGLDSKQRGCVERSSGHSRSHSSSIADNGVVNNVEPPKEALGKKSENELVLIVDDGAVNIVEPPKESLEKGSENEVLIVDDGAVNIEPLTIRTSSTIRTSFSEPFSKDSVNIEPLTISSEKSAELDCEAVETEQHANTKTGHSQNVSSGSHDGFPNNLESSAAAAARIVHQVEATESENCGNLSAQSPKVPSSTAPNRVLENLESVPFTVQKVGQVQVTEVGNAGPSGQSPEIPLQLHNGSPMNLTPGMTASKRVDDRVTATGVPERPLPFENVSNSASITPTTVTTVRTRTRTFELPGLELEAKIAKLEKQIAVLKAAARTRIPS